MIPLFDKNRRKHFPFVTISIISLCITLYIYTLIAGFDLIIFKFSIIPSRLINVMEIYRVITHMFLHGSIFHLLSNMLFLWIFGDNVEDKLGHIRFFEFFILAGIVSALLQSGVGFISGHENIPLIGASGAISAVIGAYLIMFPRAKIVTFVVLFITSMPAWVFIGIWFIIQFISAFTQFGQSNIAYFAHLSGFVFGVLWALFSNMKIRKRKRRS